MRPTFRFALCLAAAAVVGGHAVASDMRDIQQAVSDDAMLSSAGVDPAKAELRKPCQATVVDTDDPAELFDCVYVQTSRDLNLFSLEDGLRLIAMRGALMERAARGGAMSAFFAPRDRIAAAIARYAPEELAMPAGNRCELEFSNNRVDSSVPPATTTARLRTSRVWPVLLSTYITPVARFSSSTVTSTAIDSLSKVRLPVANAFGTRTWFELNREAVTHPRWQAPQ